MEKIQRGKRAEQARFQKQDQRKIKFRIRARFSTKRACANGTISADSSTIKSPKSIDAQMVIDPQRRHPRERARRIASRPGWCQTPSTAAPRRPARAGWRRRRCAAKVWFDWMRAGPPRRRMSGIKVRRVRRGIVFMRTPRSRPATEDSNARPDNSQIALDAAILHPGQKTSRAAQSVAAEIKTAIDPKIVQGAIDPRAHDRQCRHRVDRAAPDHAIQPIGAARKTPCSAGSPSRHKTRR